jgi:hypothetical protein
MTRPPARRPARLRVEVLEPRLPPAGHTIGTAEPVPLGPALSAAVAGFLAAPDQRDLYQVRLDPGDTLRAAVSARLAGSGLHPALRVFDGSGREVAAAGPAGDPELTVQAPAGGAYFVGVSSAGNAGYNPVVAGGGTPGTTTGTYSLAVTVRKNQPPAADLAGASFRLAEPTAAWGETVTAALRVRNRGGAAAGPFSVQLYLSPDERFDPAASVPLLPSPVRADGLAAGGEWAAAAAAVLPAAGFAGGPVSTLLPDLGTLASGRVFVGMRVTPVGDPGDAARPAPRRGTDWEPLTIVTPGLGTTGNVVAGELRRTESAAYPFTVPPAVGPGVFSATAPAVAPGTKVVLTLDGTPDGEPPYSVTVVGNPVTVGGIDVGLPATLTRVLTPGTYTLRVRMLLAEDDPDDRQLGSPGPLLGYAVNAQYQVTAGNTRVGIPPGDLVSLPLVVTAAGRYTAVASSPGGTITPRLRLFDLANVDAPLAQSQGRVGSPDAVLAQYLEPGRYALDVGNGDAAAGLTTTFVPGSLPLQPAPTGPGPRLAAAGDFNNDGDLDLAVVTRPEGDPEARGLSVLLGRGDGTFAPTAVQGVGVADPQAAVAGDFDGDGWADLAAAGGSGGEVRVLRGNGDGTFRPGLVVPVGGSAALAAADMNSDGLADLVVASDTSVGVFLGAGGGLFRSAGSLPLALPARSVTAADLDGDGRPDLVVSAGGNGSGAVAVFLGTGGGAVRPAPPLPARRQADPVVVADVDSDRVPDLVVGDPQRDEVQVFRGLGGGRFGAGRGVPVAATPFALAAADLNRDGRVDLVAGGPVYGTVVFLLGDGRGGFVARPAYRLADPAAAVTVADLDRDGSPDLVAPRTGTLFEPGGGADVLRGNGDGSFQGPALVTVAGPPTALAMADFDGDGRQDAAVTLADRGEVAVLLGNWDGTFTPRPAVPVGRAATAVAAGDLNRDGRPDLIAAASGDGTVAVALGNGDGTFRPATVYGVGPRPQAVRLADLNGDGFTDAVVAAAGGGVVVLLGRGDGTFAGGPPAADAVGPAGGVGLAVADLNQDGLADVVVGDERDASVTVRLGRGDGSFGQPVRRGLPYAPHDLRAADVTGDNRTDLILVNRAANSVGVLPGNGDGTFGAERTTVVDDPVAVEVGDFNTDGRRDLAVAGGRAAGGVTILLGNGDLPFRPAGRFPVGRRPAGVAVADLNADGRPDLLVGNTDGLTLAALLSLGDGTFVPTTGTNNTEVRTTPYLVPLTGAADPGTGLPVLDSVVLDRSGNILLRRGLPGFNQFAPPVVLNPGFPARDLVPVRTPTGWAVAAAEVRPNQRVAVSGGSTYTVVLYSVGADGRVRGADFDTTVLTGRSPSRLVAADLVGDGFAGDLVMVGALTGTIEIAIQRRDGSAGRLFPVPTAVAVDGGVAEAAVADVNGDGLADIVVTSQSGEMTTFLNDDAHSFEATLRGRAGMSPVDVRTVSETSVAVGEQVRVGDGRATLADPLNDPDHLTVDGVGNLYFADNASGVVRRVDAATGVITTVAGSWVRGYTGDGGPATSARLDRIGRLAVDVFGNVFAYDPTHDVVRRVDAVTGVIRTVPDDFSLGWGRDRDDRGFSYRVDGQRIVRFVQQVDGTITHETTVAGAVSPNTKNQSGVAEYGDDVYFAGPLAVYRKVAATGRVETVAAAETGAPFVRLDGLTADPAGNVYVADGGAGLIRRIDGQTGNITTVAALPQFGASIAAELRGYRPLPRQFFGGLFFIPPPSTFTGYVYVADGLTVRRVGLTPGTVGPDGPVVFEEVTVATYSERRRDGGPRSEFDRFANPVAVGPDGSVYYADNNVVRRVTPEGRNEAVAGAGPYGYVGDGGPAAAALIRYVRALAVDRDGNVFIADNAGVVRRVDARTGLISTAADLGGRFDPLTGITGLAVTAAGDLLVKGAGRAESPAGPRLVTQVVRVAAPRAVVTSYTQTVALALGNFTPDGRPDLLAVNRGAHSFSVLPGDGAGGFAAPDPRLTTSTSAGLRVTDDPGPAVAGRFRAGAAVDDAAVLVRDAGEVWVYANAGDGTFRLAQAVPVGPGAAGLTAVPTAAGGFDLLVGNAAGDVLRLVGNGDGTFAPPPAATGDRVPISVRPSAGGPVALVANQQTNRVTVQAREAGSFAPVGTLAAAAAADQLAPGDVTWSRLSRGRPLPDAVVLASGSNRVLVYPAAGARSDGTPVFAPPVGYPTGTNPVRVTVADVNGDAIPDLLVANAGSNDVSVLFGGYGADGGWVGAAGPRLRTTAGGAGGVGPLSADVIASPASPGGLDLAVTARDGTVSVLPGRGNGFFDDTAPRVIALGAPLRPQAPSFAPGGPVGFVVTEAGAVLRFDAAAGGPPVVTTARGVQLVQALDRGRVIEVRAGGGVVLVSAGGTAVLAARGGAARDPSGVAVLEFAGDALEVLVTSAGSEAIHEYAARAAGGTGGPPTFETITDLTALDADGQVVPTLVTTLVTGAGPPPLSAAAGPGLIDPAATGPSADDLSRLGGLSDDDLVPTAGELLLGTLFLTLGNESAAGGGTGVDPIKRLDPLSDGIDRLVEALRAGRPAGGPAGGPDPVGPLDRLLEALRKLLDGGGDESDPAPAAPGPPRGPGADDPAPSAGRPAGPAPTSPTAGLSDDTAPPAPGDPSSAGGAVTWDATPVVAAAHRADGPGTEPVVDPRVVVLAGVLLLPPVLLPTRPPPRGYPTRRLVPLPRRRDATPGDAPR